MHQTSATVKVTHFPLNSPPSKLLSHVLGGSEQYEWGAEGSKGPMDCPSLLNKALKIILILENLEGTIFLTLAKENQNSFSFISELFNICKSNPSFKKGMVIFLALKG